MEMLACFEIFRRFSLHHPNPVSELHFKTPFQLLIAVILSAQSTDKSVNKVTSWLFSLAPTPQAILSLEEDGLRKMIQMIGLYRSKTRYILETCQQLVERYDGKVPEDRQALESLPGVGRKTANVVLNVAFGQPTIAVDTHVFRVANRTGLAPGGSPLAVEQGLLAVTPEEFKQNAHHWLILHGRYVCLARRPKCHQCLIEDLCEKHLDRRSP